MPLVYTMRCLISNNSNPYFNLAAEEYFLKNSNEEFFILYINEPSVIVGKHQNLLSEINLRHIRENNIKITRRISGGGAVYHDFNNLNFSFIHNCINRDQINLGNFTLPVLVSLKEMGIKAEFSGRNDLLIDSKKISGNAMHIYKSRVLSHGTLLYNSNLQHLSSSLANNSLKYTDKSIKSVRSNVTTIIDHYDRSKSIDYFKNELFKKIAGKSQNSYYTPINTTEEKCIREISNKKFESWDWIYGYSPKYSFKNTFLFSDLLFQIELNIEKGTINTVKLNVNDADFTHAINELANVRHDFNLIEQMLRNNSKINSILNINITELCYNLF